MDNLFYIKLYILVKLDVLSLLDSTEHFFYFFQLAKTFWNTNFFSIKYQNSSEFSPIGMPHFSLECVIEGGKLMALVDCPANNEQFTYQKYGLGRNAIKDMILTHMRV